MSTILDLLFARFAEPEWFASQEVTLGNRRADFLAVNLWRSRGRRIVAVEIKNSRSDWLRELKDPEKQERIFRQCDQIYLAVSDPAIVKDGELPDGWGLFVKQKSRLVQKVRPATAEKWKLKYEALQRAVPSLCEDYLRVHREDY